MNFFIKNGFISKTSANILNQVGSTDLVHILKQMLTRLHVTFTDECCPDTGFSPVRRNNTTNKLEYYDYATKEYVLFTPTP